jgi:ribosomal protein L17
VGPKCAGTVVCTKCEEEKSIAKFYVNPKTGRNRAKCKQCMNADHKDYAKRNPLVVRRAVDKASLKYRNSEKGKARAERYNREYHEEHKELLNARVVDWRRSNKGAVNHYKAKRRALHRNATPSWANIEEIKHVYATARALGMVVDHIIPLRGKTVSGLHVENNLQIISRIENARKYNKYAVQDIV